MHLIARVRNLASDRPVVGRAAIIDGELEMVDRYPDPVWLLIEPPSESGDGFLLHYLDEDKSGFADFWFLSLEEAKVMGWESFGVPHDAWTPYQPIADLDR